MCYEYGWGVKKNLKKSKYWYDREKGIESDSTEVKSPQKQAQVAPQKKAPQKQRNNFDNVNFDDL